MVAANLEQVLVLVSLVLVMMLALVLVVVLLLVLVLVSLPWSDNSVFHMLSWGLILWVWGGYTVFRQ